VTPPRVVSVHFPKAAGSSLWAQFARLLGDKAALDFTHDPFTSAGSESAEFPAEKTLVHGHFRAKRYESTDAYWMTFLRHPVDNLISIYFYWKSLREPGHSLHARFLAEVPSLLEFALYPGINRLMSEMYFGGFDMNRFGFIGFYETRDISLARLGNELGLPLVADVHENRTKETVERLALESDPRIRRRLTDLLGCDVAFYERMRMRI
jgi:hypothetical protein